MANAERLMTLKNVTPNQVRVGWDGTEFVWEPGEEKTLRYGVGLHCRDSRQSALTVVDESFGIAPETVVVEAKLVNNGKDTLTVSWDGIPHVFEPGEVVVVDQSLAHPLMTNARQIIARDDLDATLDIVGGEPTTEAPAAEEAPAPKPRRTRKPKSAAETPVA